MITRPMPPRRIPPPDVPRPLPVLRSGLAARFRPPPPHMPLDPTMGPQKPVIAQPLTGLVGPAYPSSRRVPIPFGQ